MALIPLFFPGSPQSAAIDHLFLVVGVVMVAILGLVTGLVLYAVYRFHHRPDDGEPPQIFGRPKVEIGWTAGSLLVVIFIFVISLRTMHQADPPATPNDSPSLVITAHQWWWQVDYPKRNVVTANEVHIPTGRRLLVELKSADVVHDWWVPQLGRKMDAIPGHPNYFWIEADKAGTYLGRCAEFCGAEHAWMRIRVIATPPAEFQQWERQQLVTPAKPTAGEAAEGERLFQNLLTCSDCHRIAGTSANSSVGPDLTHIANRETLATGRLKNTPSNLRQWLKNPQAIKPGVHMPDFQLTDKQVDELSAYLESLK